MADAFNVTRFLLTICLMLFTAKVLGELFTKIKQPAIMGEIIAGLILGPTILGTLFPSLFNWFFPEGTIPAASQGIITLAVVLLLLVSGLEVDLTIVLRQGRAAVYTGLLGIIIPFFLGFTSAYMFPEFFSISDPASRTVFALFMGTAMSISALPVIAKSLMDIGIFKTEVGSIIISAAMFNDIVGWLIFSLILGKIGTGSHPFSFGNTLLLTLSFAVVAVVLFRKIINRVIPYLQTKISYPGGMLNFIFILGLLGAAFTEYIGVHAIFGSFIMGIAIGNSVHLKEDIRENINQFITNLFAPLFFVSIGLRVNFWLYFDLPIVVIITLIAFTGKVIGCSIGAKLGGLVKEDALAVGFGMNSRGAMEIILGIIALEAGLINEKIFVALVIMAVITSVSGAPLMNYFLKKKKITFAGILKPDLILLTDYRDKNSVIRQLVESTASYYKLDANKILAEVMNRENENPTGIANYLALPHGRIKYTRPVAAAAINKSGIDFSSLDGTGSKIIVLLLTPRDKNEIQLRLLSEIGNKFRDKNRIEEFLKSPGQKEFIKLIG